MLRSTMLAPAQTAAIGIKAMLKGRRSVIAGGMNRLTAFSSRLMPRGVMLRMMGRSLRNAS
ncbi:hypothetical protein [Pukyongiella litopenaei]|uniref:Uncharacterized protein n=1 Tax=Pukyongiella litopenaei TaxID=2605946 RepID=A0A2S0MRK3_9RHOB|nr:hypothetical protein [Pukyongiella litopenaei]AVO38457.2 hypothetical protein C6Y53_12685 [Pukyongiella litopenaei]